MVQPFREAAPQPSPLVLTQRSENLVHKEAYAQMFIAA